jgi:hypothetical protein
MITNAHRSGSDRVARGEDRKKPQDDIRSGAVSDGPIKEQVMTFGLRRRQKIIEVNGVRRLVDA